MRPGATHRCPGTIKWRGRTITRLARNRARKREGAREVTRAFDAWLVWSLFRCIDEYDARHGGPPPVYIEIHPGSIAGREIERQRREGKR